MKNSNMKRQGLNRRQFIQNSAVLAGTALLSPWALSGFAPPPPDRSANAPPWTR